MSDSSQVKSTDQEKRAAAQAEEALKKKAPGGQIACREALALANELDVAPRVVGDAANKLGVKIRACQLGCFK